MTIQVCKRIALLLAVFGVAVLVTTGCCACASAGRQSFEYRTSAALNLKELNRLASDGWTAINPTLHLFEKKGGSLTGEQFVTMTREIGRGNPPVGRAYHFQGGSWTELTGGSVFNWAPAASQNFAIIPFSP